MFRSHPGEQESRVFQAKMMQLPNLTHSASPTHITIRSLFINAIHSSYPPENTDVWKSRFYWNFCHLHKLKLLEHSLKPLSERRKKIKKSGCIEKLKSSPSLKHGEHLLVRRWEKASFRAAFLPPFQDASLKLPSSLNSEWPCWQGHAGSLPAIKMDFLSFHCGWKCSISVCDFNFTADWHLQRQKILIKLQEHLIQWLAGGKELLAAPFFWLC